MLFKIEATWPRRGPGALLFPIREKKAVTKSDAGFPLGRRGFMAIIRWAQTEFPGASIRVSRLDVAEAAK